jgi:hypothetical protein
VFALTELGPKEAEVKIPGCDLYARQQTLAMLDTTTGEIVNMILKHEGDNVREFYSKLPRPVLVGIEATGVDAVVFESHGKWLIDGDDYVP